MLGFVLSPCHPPLPRSIQPDLGGVSTLVLGHQNKVNTAIKESLEFFGFPVYTKVRFGLYCSLLSVH